MTPSRPTADAPDRKRAHYSFLDSSPSACIPYFAYFVEIVWGKKPSTLNSAQLSKVDVSFVVGIGIIHYGIRSDSKENSHGATPVPRCNPDSIRKASIRNVSRKLVSVEAGSNVTEEAYYTVIRRRLTKNAPMGNSGALVDLTNASSDEGEEILSDSEYDFDDDDEDYNYEGFDDMMAEATTSSADADQASPVCFHETLRGDDVYKEMMNAVQEMAVVVNLPQDDVLRLLSRYDWDTARFQVCLVSWYHPFAAV